MAAPNKSDVRAGPSFSLKVPTWIVMGLTTVREELQQLLEDHDPDIVVLTESKLTERTQRKCWLFGALKSHSLQFSSCQHLAPSCGLRRGSGGVAVAVRKTLGPQGCFVRLPVQTAHRSHLLQLLLQPPASRLHAIRSKYTARHLRSYQDRMRSHSTSYSCGRHECCAIRAGQNWYGNISSRPAARKVR